jgi:hypothetical protein
MFSRRRSLSGARTYTREFFEKLLADLKEGGFPNLVVKLPHNLVGMDNSTLSPDEFLRRERNYASLILVAQSVRSDETLKILFVNRNAKTFFVDDTFPSGESQPPALYFQSPDPGRAYAVFAFFYDYLTEPRLTTHWLLVLLSLAALLLLAAEALALIALRGGLLYRRWLLHPIWDVLAIAVALLVLFRFFAEPKGLWVKPERELYPIQLLRMALRGDFRDNPLVMLVVTIVGTVIAGLIMRWLGIV